MASELVALSGDECDDPKFAVCYAKGASFRKEGHLYRVEKGARTVVHRALCLIHCYGKRCEICPNGNVKVQLEIVNGVR